jgi:hypothetical protein
MGLYIRIYRDFLVGLYRAIIQWWWMMIWYDMIWHAMIWYDMRISWNIMEKGILWDTVFVMHRSYHGIHRKHGAFGIWLGGWAWCLQSGRNLKSLPSFEVPRIPRRNHG